MQTYGYGSTSNQLLTISGQLNRTLTYDAAGNVIADMRGADTFTYAYNAANRMSAVSKNGVLQASYVYNAAGQQVIVEDAVTGTTTHIIHDLEGRRIAEYDFDPVSGSRTLLREYV